MPLTGYPQTHLSPDVTVAIIQNDTTQHRGPFSSLKLMGDATSDAITLYLYLDKASYDKATGSQVAGTDYYVVEGLATDVISGPIYGFRFHTDSDDDTSVIAYKYSTGI